jgi:hypothetical protein
MLQMLLHELFELLGGGRTCWRCFVLRILVLILVLILILVLLILILRVMGRRRGTQLRTLMLLIIINLILIIILLLIRGQKKQTGGAKESTVLEQLLQINPSYRGQGQGKVRGYNKNMIRTCCLKRVQGCRSVKGFTRRRKSQETSSSPAPLPGAARFSH